MHTVKSKIAEDKKAKQIFIRALKHHEENLEYPKVEYLGGVFREGDLYIGFWGKEFFSEEFSCKEEAIKYAKGESCKDLYGQHF